MVIKLIGLGFIQYVRDPYNIFDATIGNYFICFHLYLVTISIVDVVLSYSLPAGTMSKGKGAISVFRTFRLLRAFKLAKNMKRLQTLLVTIFQSLKDIVSFAILLFLLIFVYLLIGLEIFAIKPSEYE